MCTVMISSVPSRQPNSLVTGFNVIPVGSKMIAQFVPCELNTDHTTAMVFAQEKGFITASVLRQKTEFTFQQKCISFCFSSFSSYNLTSSTHFSYILTVFYVSSCSPVLCPCIKKSNVVVTATTHTKHIQMQVSFVLLYYFVCFHFFFFQFVVMLIITFSYHDTPREQQLIDCHF